MRAARARKPPVGGGRGVLLCRRRVRAGQAPQERQRHQREHSEAGKGGAPAHEVGDDAAEARGEALPGERDAHEDAHRGAAALRAHHVAHMRLRDRDDARRKAARDHARCHEQRQRGRHGAEKRPHGEAGHDHVEHAEAAEAVAERSADRLEQAVRHEVGSEHDRCRGGRHAERVCDGGQRRRDKPVVGGGHESAKAQRVDDTLLLGGEVHGVVLRVVLVGPDHCSTAARAGEASLARSGPVPSPSGCVRGCKSDVLLGNAPTCGFAIAR